ncbi:MAG: hypothetical protein C0401_09790 [Anaerolinea sp.]|nr:hypothetical protein [Anaerolinea sp.]
MKHKFSTIFSLVVIMVLSVNTFAIASTVDVAVVDVIAPTGSVTLPAGGNGPITINMSVTGKQEGTATFEVYRDWSLSGGVFTGSNPQEFTVAPRAAQDAATTFSTTGTVTVATGQGSGTFTLAVSTFDITNSNATGSKLADGADGNYQVTVTAPTPSDTTPPVISYVLTPSTPGGANGWYTGNVTLVWTVTDPESTVTKTGCVDQSITADQGATTYSCSATSAGGSSGPVTVTIKRDSTAPVVSISPDTLPDYNTWYNNPVVFTISGTDATSGIASCDSAVNYNSPDNLTAEVTGNCKDNAGNVGSNQVGFQYDGTVPTISVAVTPEPIAGWYNQTTGAPTATFACGDATAGIESCTAPYTFGEGTDLSTSGTAKDNAGNTATAEVTGIDIDLTATSISFVSRTPANANGWNNTDVTVEWSCSDAGSGVVEASVSQIISSEGFGQTATGTCVDLAGNSASDTQIGINIDKTDPIVTITPDRPVDFGDWYNALIGFSVAGNGDDLSGIESCTAPFSYSAPDSAAASVYGSCTDKAGNSADGSFDFKYDATAPTEVLLTAFGALGANGWFIDDVTIVTSGVDEISGISCTPDQDQMDETTGAAFYGSCINGAGLSTDGAPITVKLDKTGPSAVLSAEGIQGWDVWFTGIVTIKTSGTDDISSPVACTPDQPLTIDTIGDIFNASCTNDAGLTTGAIPLTVKRDATAPTISANVSPALPATGWWNINSGAPTASFVCSDATSGVFSCSEAYIFSEGENQSHTGSAVDNAGNSATAGVADIDVDLTAPSITWIGGPADGAVYYFGFVPVAPTCTASDALSGEDGCQVSGYGTAIGVYTLTAKALDKAGNSKVETRSYTVLKWELKGFYQPVDMNGVMNTVKAGSTVPLKFEVFAATELSDISIVKTLAKQVTCTAIGEDTIEVLATGGTSLRYDTIAGQFIFNWQTPKLPGKCYSVTMTTQDGSSLTAIFKLK